MPLQEHGKESLHHPSGHGNGRMIGAQGPLLGFWASQAEGGPRDVGSPARRNTDGERGRLMPEVSFDSIFVFFGLLAMIRCSICIYSARDENCALGPHPRRHLGCGTTDACGPGSVARSS